MSAVEEPQEPPSYPRLDKSTSVTVTRPYKQSVWVGEKARLLRVQSLLEDALEKAYVGALRSAEAELAADPDTRDWTRQHRLDELANQYRLTVAVVGRENKWTRSGELSSIFDAVELDDIHSVEMSSGGYRAEAQVSVKFLSAKDEFSDAVSVVVSGRDHGWVTGLHDSLATLIAKDKPWWGIMRRVWVSVIACLLLALGLVGSLMFAAPNLGSEDLGALLVVVPGTAGLAGLFFVHPLFLRAFPAFEIVSPGSSGLGARRLAAIGSICGFILGVVILPILISALME